MGSPQINDIGFWGSGGHDESEGFRFSHEQIEKLQVQIEAESYYGAFRHIASMNLL